MAVKYDYLIVGAGLYGAVFAHEAVKAGRSCLVIDKRDHIGGNIYTEEIEGINVHKYGAHIFHTSNKAVWDFMNGFAEFNRYTNSPVAIYKDELYNLPFNMNTFHALWGVVTPEELHFRREGSRRTWLKLRSDSLEKTSLKNLSKDILPSSGEDVPKNFPPLSSKDFR